MDNLVDNGLLYSYSYGFKMIPVGDKLVTVYNVNLIIESNGRCYQVIEDENEKTAKSKAVEFVQNIFNKD